MICEPERQKEQEKRRSVSIGCSRGLKSAAYAASGYFMHHQHGVGNGNTARIPFDQKG
jgi:hypothetical protein